MTELKKVTPSKLLWLDLEMTGLQPTTDRIVEVAAIVTDWTFAELGSIELGVKQDEPTLRQLFSANPFAAARPAETEELIAVSLSGASEQQAQTALLDLLDQHVAPGEIALLAGNSIHCDRGFIRRYWPRLEQRLHYRMLDVSAWKVVMQGKYNIAFTKKEQHRALGDIRESIDELRYYLQRATFGQE